MPEGYFDNGAVSIELGAHAFVSPGPEHSVLALTDLGSPSVILPDGGGVIGLDVTAQRLRENMGDAERWAYELLAALATAAPGTLGVADRLGRQVTFADAVCTAGVGQVHGARFADVRLTFAAPCVAAQPAYGSAPATADTYAGTSTAQDYAADAGAGAVTLGIGEGMRLEMLRQYPVRPVPRARGARSVGPAAGAMLRLTVMAWARPDSEHLSAYLDDLARQVGPGAVELSGNGNTYEDCVLQALRPRHTDWLHTSFEAEFLQQVGAGASSGATTTPGA